MNKKICSLFSFVLSAFIMTGCNFDFSNLIPSTPANTAGTFLHGKGAPAESLGENYAHYYDEESRYVYEKNNGKWINKYTIGGEGLYKELLLDETPLARKQESTKEKREKLISMLSNSFYSTNISASYCYVDASDTMADGTYDLQIKVNKEYYYMFSNDNDSISYHCRSTQDGLELYMDGEYQKLTGEEMIFTMLPFPSFDSITYHNFGIYQEDLGQMTAIVAANINKAYFDEESGFYKIDKIKIKHGELTDSCYLQQADNLTFSFAFKPSANNEYVEVAYFNVLESELVEFAYKMKISFYDYHQTQVFLP